MKRPVVLVFALLALLLLGAAPCAQPECVKLGHPGAAQGYWSGLVGDVIKQLQGSGGKTKQVMSVSLNDLGGVNNALMAMRNGYVDIAVIPNTVLAREIPAFDVLNLPLEIRDLRHAGRVSGSSLERRLQAEAAKKGVRLLGFAWRGGTFFSRTRCIVAPTDVRGAKVIDGRDQHARLLTDAGAAVIELPGADLVAALERGLAESALLTIELLDVLNLGAPKTCLTRPGSAPFMILPEVLVAVLGAGGKDTLDASFIAQLGKLGDVTLAAVAKAGEALEKKYASRKAEVASIGETERAAWSEIATPIREEYLKRVEGGKALLDALRELR